MVTSAGLVPAEKLADRRFVPSWEKMCVPLHQGDTRPAALDLKREQILVEGIVPARPGVPAIVWREFGVEAGTAHRPFPGRVDLPTVCASMIGIRPAQLRSKHRSLAMRKRA